jgi:hypothetical protein
MGRIYTVPFNGTVTAAGTDTDLWSFQPADDKPIKLRGFTLGQISEVGDTRGRRPAHHRQAIACNIHRRLGRQLL